MKPQTTIESQAALCTYTRREDGIHEFILHSATREAADAYFDHMEAVMTQAMNEGLTANDTVRVLADFRIAGNPPLNYMFNRTKVLTAKYPVRPKVRLANLHQSGVLISLAQAFTSMLTAVTKDKVRILKGDNVREEAIVWLLKDD